MFKLFLSLSVCLTLSLAQFPINGTCPDLTQCRTTVDMRDEVIRGIWYQYATLPYTFQLNKKCTFFDFSPLGNHTFYFDKYEFDIQ